jgi:pimeloyl-ACP methyl ester carboxylesterase
VESLSRRHGFDALHLIGHDTGGLIARRYIQSFGGDRRAKSLITLGTPHHRLSSQERPVPENIPLTSIYSTSDLVCRARTSRLRHTDAVRIDNLQVSGVGHSELAWDPGVYRLIRERLEAAARSWSPPR